MKRFVRNGFSVSIAGGVVVGPDFIDLPDDEIARLEHLLEAADFESEAPTDKAPENGEGASAKGKGGK